MTWIKKRKNVYYIHAFNCPCRHELQPPTKLKLSVSEWLAKMDTEMSSKMLTSCTTLTYDLWPWMTSARFVILPRFISYSIISMLDLGEAWWPLALTSKMTPIVAMLNLNTEFKLPGGRGRHEAFAKGCERSRNRLNVCSDIRLAVSKTEPNIKGLVRRGQEQVSHWWWLYSQFLILLRVLC